MGQLELHFFHGFLGVPSDWRAVIECLPENWSVSSHNILQDSHNLKKDFFSEWARMKEFELSQNVSKKILIGYSLGGRLLYHLQHEVYEKLILVASHPGLLRERSVRLSSDEEWVQKMKELSWADWLKAWNSQDVFSNDRLRPERLQDEKRCDQWAQVLKEWSLAKQVVMDSKIKNHRHKIFWGYGSEDIKFKKLRSRLSQSLEESHLFEIEGAGHGVLFDQPKALAQKIMEIVNDDK